MPVPSPLLPFLTDPPRRVRFSVRPRSPEVLEDVEELLAGVAEADLTPPPGMPKAGYSANAHHGSGFRSRLRARVIHLRSGRASLAIVQCDLLGGSAVVQHLVAQAIADETDVALAGLFIGATHTHAGPGQYLGTDFYNRFASNKSGFDPAYTQFLVDQIAGAVIAACASRRPARLAVGTVDVWGLTRNRSLAAHVRNPEIEDPSTPPQRKFHAINPGLHLLRVDSVTDGAAINGSGSADAAGPATTPLGAMVVFSVHGTGVPMTADEYNADIWAYLVGELRHRIGERTGVTPVVGAIEGTHADVAPAIRPGTAGHLEAARLGRAIGAHAADLHHRLGAELTGSVELAAGLREVDLETSPTIGAVTLPRRPAVGAALVAGAHENVTPVVHRIPPFAPGRPKAWGRATEQGPKWIIGSRWLQPLMLRLTEFPRILPVQVLRIGTTALVGLPFELTVETGCRIEAAVAGAIAATGAPGPAIDRVIVSSVANEYSGYATTPEEYELQHYEGAHTLYGPATQPFLTAHAAALAADAVAGGTVQDVVAERRFDLKARRHLPGAVPGDRTERQVPGPARFVDPTRSTDGYWELEWLDVAPGNLHWHEPLVQVESSDGDGWALATHDGRPLDDRGWDLQVTHLGGGADGHRYAARWWDPTFQGGRSYRFVLLANAGRPEVTSEAFR